MKLDAPEGYTFAVTYEHRRLPIDDDSRIGYVVLRLMRDYTKVADEAGVSLEETLKVFGGVSPVLAERKVFVDSMNEVGIVRTVQSQAADMVNQLRRDEEIREILQRNFG